MRRTLPSLLLILAFTRFDATASPACVIQQVTHTTGVTGNAWPTLDESGTRVLFFSSLNLTGNNADGGLDLVLLDTTTMTFSPVTAFNPAPFLFQDASISADGTRALYLASNTLYGTIEPFLVTIGSPVATQITPNDGAGTNRPAMNADGSRVTFSTIKNLAGLNPDLSPELYLFTEGAGFAQVTDNLPQPTHPAINHAGDRILFRVGNPGPDYAIYTTSGGGPVPVTGVRYRGASGDLVLSGDGSTGAFVSRQDGTADIYLISEGQTRQITFADVAAPGDWNGLSISTDGSRLVARRDDGTTFRPNVYLHDDAAGVGVSVYDYGYYPSLSGNGMRIAFVTWADPVGTNPDANWELFLATCPVPLDLRLDPTDLLWDSHQFATGYDVVRGDLALLRNSAGDFSQAIDTCLADDSVTTSVPHGSDPAPGQGFFYLAREILATGPASYDEGGRGQVGTRDAEIDAAAQSCP